MISDSSVEALIDNILSCVLDKDGAQYDAEKYCRELVQLLRGEGERLASAVELKQELSAFSNRLTAKMMDLSADAMRALLDNLWNLYESLGEAERPAPAAEPTNITHEHRSPDGDGQFNSEVRAKSVEREGQADDLAALATREASATVGKTPLRDGDAERRCAIAAERLVKSGRARSGQLVGGPCAHDGEISAQSGNPEDDMRVETLVAGSTPADALPSPAEPSAVTETPADIEDRVIRDVADHWFLQGGQAQFGPLAGDPRNADDVIVAILQVVRKYHPPIADGRVAAPPAVGAPLLQIQQLPERWYQDNCHASECITDLEQALPEVQGVLASLRESIKVERDILAATASAHAERVEELEAARDALLKQKINLGFELGQVLGQEYDGARIVDVVRELKQSLDALQKEKDSDAWHTGWKVAVQQRDAAERFLRAALLERDAARDALIALQKSAQALVADWRTRDWSVHRDLYKVCANKLAALLPAAEGQTS